MPITRSASASASANPSATSNPNPVGLPTIEENIQGEIRENMPLEQPPGVVPPPREAAVISAKTLEKQLRPFDGTKGKLEEFLSSCDTVMRLCNPAEKPI
ncbi:unnamed protein product, partial [Nesidiocoris tenuis]